jgi:hypothetical protein
LHLIVGEATTTVSATPDDVFDFVLDLHRYRRADHKIGRVGTIDNEGDHETAQFSGRVRGLPGPSGTYPFTRTASRLEFGSPVAGAARWFLDFEGTFDTERTDEGTVVTHREVIRTGAGWRFSRQARYVTWFDGSPPSARAASPLPNGTNHPRSALVATANRPASSRVDDLGRCPSAIRWRRPVS